jgi:hypothetical protein
MLTEKEKAESQTLPDSSIEKEIGFTVEEEMELKEALDDHCNEMDKIIENFSKSFQVRSCPAFAMWIVSVTSFCFLLSLVFLIQLSLKAK